MNKIMEILCSKCNEPERGHMKPFTLERRSCIIARLYRKCKDSIFCRRPEW